MADKTDETKRLREFYNVALTDNCWSPDIGFLSAKFDWVPLFVHGQLKKGLSKHHYIDDCPYEGIGYTFRPDFVMYRTKSNQPVILHGKDSPHTTGHIYGEIFLVNPERLAELDKYFENTLFVRREEIPIRWWKPSDKSLKEKKNYLSKCFAYVSNPKEFKGVIDAGHAKMMPLNISRKTQQPYFVFSQAEDQNNQRRM